MRQSASQQAESHATTLLQVAEYLRRPQQSMAVAEARAAFRHTLERSHEASIVLTANGEPTAALAGGCVYRPGAQREDPDARPCGVGAAHLPFPLRSQHG